MYKITLNPDKSINEVFKVGRSKEIPESAQKITDKQAKQLLACTPTDYDCINGEIVINPKSVCKREVVLLLKQKHAEIEDYYADKLSKYGVESLKDLRLAAALSTKPNRFTKALSFIEALNLEAMPKNKLELFDIASAPKKPDLK